MENNSSNILTPVVDVICDTFTTTCKMIYKTYLNSKGEETPFNFKEYFDDVKLYTVTGKGVIKPKQIKKEKTIKGEKYIFSIPVGFGCESLLKFKDSLESAIGYKTEFSFEGNYWIIEIIKNKLKGRIDYTIPNKTNDLIIPIGESIEGIVNLNLRDNPNVYVVGTTGSGKSVCLKSILTSLVNLYSPKELELILCDLKRVELSLFRKLEHVKKFVYSVEDTTDTINEVLEECEKRFELFSKRNVVNIWEYNKLVRNKLPYKFLIIEEVVNLLQDKKGIGMKYLKQLTSICRACGIQVILTMQRPSNDVLDVVVKSNITNRICFKTEDLKNSIIALDDEGCEKLKGKGHGIFKTGSIKKEFQSYFITDEEVKEYIKPYIKKGELKTTSRQIGFIDNKKKESKKDGDIDLSFIDKL